MAKALPEEQRFAVAVLQRWKKPVTPRSVKNMIGWMRAEGGHWHNSARFNPLNTTQNMPGSGDTGSQGNISVYRNWDQGVQATVQTLNNGRYGAIAANVNRDPNSFARAVNSTPWGTKSNFSSITNSIGVGNLPASGPVRSAQSAGANRPRDPGAGPSSPVPGSSIPTLTPEMGKGLMALLDKTTNEALQGKMPGEDYGKQLGAIAKLLQSQVATATRVPAAAKADPIRDLPMARPSAPSGSALKGFILGSPVPGQSPHSSSHQTSGLAGYPAFDYMTKAGTKVAAPVGGRVFRLSGKDPRRGGSPGGPLGYSIYIQGDNGKKYFLTHLDRVGVKVGQKVRAGQQIAVVANGPSSWSSPHVHMGVSG